MAWRDKPNASSGKGCCCGTSKPERWRMLGTAPYSDEKHTFVACYMSKTVHPRDMWSSTHLDRATNCSSNSLPPSGRRYPQVARFTKHLAIGAWGPRFGQSGIKAVGDACAAVGKGDSGAFGADSTEFGAHRRTVGEMATCSQ